MGKLRFEDGYGYDPASKSIVCHAYDGDKHIYCIVPVELLHDVYGTDRIGAEQAFVQNLADIRALTQQFYNQHGAPDGKLIVYPRDES